MPKPLSIGMRKKIGKDFRDGVQRWFSGQRKTRSVAGSGGSA
jgi:hypothetical protein